MAELPDSLFPFAAVLNAWQEQEIQPRPVPPGWWLAAAQPAIQLISDNRKVRHHYGFWNRSVRLDPPRQRGQESERQVPVDEAYGRVKETLWLIGCNIADIPRPRSGTMNKCPRQLLIHKREMARFLKKAKEKGLTLVPLRMYFSPRGLAKCELALCKGLKLHDKREKMKTADARRDIERAVKRRRS